MSLPDLFFVLSDPQIVLKHEGHFLPKMSLPSFSKSFSNAEVDSGHGFLSLCYASLATISQDRRIQGST